MKQFAKFLAKCRVHIGGVGRIGSSVAIALHEAGVGEITFNDPQTFEVEQLKISGYSRRSDVGRPKVHVLERFFDGRPNLMFLPVVAKNQEPKLQPYLEQADVIVSCANQLDARLHLERMAIGLGKPIVQACAQDGRYALGGLVSVWMPGTNCSCFGCLFPGLKSNGFRGEVLLPTITKTIGSFAAALTIEILGGCSLSLASKQNVFVLDLISHRLEPMAIDPRPGCQICGASRQG